MHHALSTTGQAQQWWKSAQLQHPPAKPASKSLIAACTKAQLHKHSVPDSSTGPAPWQGLVQLTCLLFACLWVLLNIVAPHALQCSAKADVVRDGAQIVAEAPDSVQHGITELRHLHSSKSTCAHEQTTATSLELQSLDVYAEIMHK